MANILKNGYLDVTHFDLLSMQPIYKQIVEKNEKLALQLYKKAVSLGSKEAKEILKEYTK